VKSPTKGFLKEAIRPKASIPCKNRWMPATAKIIKKKTFSFLSFWLLIQTKKTSKSRANPTKKDERVNTIRSTKRNETQQKVNKNKLS
jgi:hypothetical protein